MRLPTIVPVTEFRTRALEAVRRVNRLGDELIITTKGKPAAVLLSYDEWKSIVETLAIKENPHLMSQIRASLRYLRRGGKGIPLEKITWDRR